MAEKGAIGLDYSHNNVLTLEASSYADFTQYLFTSGYKLGKVQAGFDSLKKLENYRAIIISSPRNNRLSEEEIETLHQYVKNGGSLLIVSSSGGDLSNKANLNDLTEEFGFKFVKDEVNDSMNYVNLQKRPLLTKFKPHVVTEQVKKIVFSSACSLDVKEFLEDEDIKIEILATAGLNCWHKRHDDEQNKWVEEDSPKIPLLVAIEYYKGKVVAFGSNSIFSSLGREYGFSAFDNDILIANILRWLSIGGITEGKVVTVNLNLDLFYWANSIMEDQAWENISDIINLSLKYFKDNYKEAIERITKLQEEKIKKRKAYEKAKVEAESAEDKILELVPVARKKEDLEDIMSALEDITGEKYELTIDLDEVEDDSEEEVEEEFDELETQIGEELEEQFEKERLELEDVLEKEMDMEQDLIMDSAKKEIERQIDKEIEDEQSEKIDEELGKRIGEDIEKVKDQIREKAKKQIEKEKRKIIKKVKAEIIEKGFEELEEERKELMEQARKIIEERKEKILINTREEMEKDRAERIKIIKKREIEIIKDNEDFFDSIMEAADLFDAPKLDDDDEDELDEEDEIEALEDEDDEDDD